MTAETAVSNQPLTVSRWANFGPRAKDFFTHVVIQPRILKKALRLAPPLVITQSEIDAFIECLDTLLCDVEK